jgi:hypothetical protein
VKRLFLLIRDLFPVRVTRIEARRALLERR